MEPSSRIRGVWTGPGMAEGRQAKAIAAGPAGSRHEFKYLVPDDLARAVTRAATTWFDRDPYLAPGHSEYVVTSLYLDTPNLDFYRDRQCQRFDRVKVRVRTYGPRNEGPAFLEIKRRRGDTMMKTRVRAPDGRWQEALGPGSPDLGSWDLSPQREAVVRDFASLCTGRSLRPVTVVRYDREAYIGRVRSDLRLTVDRRLRQAPTSRPTIPADDRAYRSMDTGHAFVGGGSLAVLEVKFTGRHPLWLEDLLARFDLPRVSFSKYMTAVDATLNEAWLSCPGARCPRMA
jgi:SPX domain protein involved in polyphosphate accumulation